MARCDHPGIARIYACADHEGEPYCSRVMISMSSALGEGSPDRTPRADVPSCMTTYRHQQRHLPNKPSSRNEKYRSPAMIT
jgi:hypothetical protein